MVWQGRVWKLGRSSAPAGAPRCVPVARRGFYAWSRPLLSTRARQDVQLRVKVRASFEAVLDLYSRFIMALEDAQEVEQIDVEGNLASAQDIISNASALWREGRCA